MPYKGSAVGLHCPAAARESRMGEGRVGEWKELPPGIRDDDCVALVCLDDGSGAAVEFDGGSSTRRMALLWR